jgi:hypothetical protein
VPTPSAPPKRVLNPHAAAAQPQPPPPHPAETALAEERAANATYAAAALASLPTDALRKTVTDSVGTDPKMQLKMIAAMQANGLASLPAIGGQANTAPSTTQTPVAGANADPDIIAAQQLAEMSKDPRRALATSRFRQQNEAAIKRGVAKLASKTTP